MLLLLHYNTFRNRKLKLRAEITWTNPLANWDMKGKLATEYLRYNCNKSCWCLNQLKNSFPMAVLDEKLLGESEKKKNSTLFIHSKWNKIFIHALNMYLVMLPLIFGGQLLDVKKCIEYFHHYAKSTTAWYWLGRSLTFLYVLSIKYWFPFYKVFTITVSLLVHYHHHHYH